MLRASVISAFWKLFLSTTSVLHICVNFYKPFYFIEMGGIIEGIVADINYRRSPIPSGGLEIKLKLYFRH